MRSNCLTISQTAGNADRNPRDAGVFICLIKICAGLGRLPHLPPNPPLPSDTSPRGGRKRLQLVWLSREDGRAPLRHRG